jgi:hypothetical protein
MGWERTVVAQFVFVQDAALTLVDDVCYPYSSDVEVVLFASLEEFIP